MADDNRRVDPVKIWRNFKKRESNMMLIFKLNFNFNYLMVS